MSSRKQIPAVLLFSLGSLPVFAGCLLPPAPSKIPDGASASETEMVTAMQTLKEYDGDVNVYLKCLEFEERMNRLSHNDRAQQNNAALTELQRIAGKFNEQVRVFKAKHG